MPGNGTGRHMQAQVSACKGEQAHASAQHAECLALVVEPPKQEAHAWAETGRQAHASECAAEYVVSQASHAMVRGPRMHGGWSGVRMHDASGWDLRADAGMCAGVTFRVQWVHSPAVGVTSGNPCGPLVKEGAWTAVPRPLQKGPHAPSLARHAPAF